MAESGLSTVIQQQDEHPGARLAQMVMQMKEQKHQQATEGMQTMLNMIEKGVPVDPKQAEKALKEWQKSGQSIGQRVLEGGKTLLGKDQGKAIQAVGKAGAQPSGAQSGTPVSDQAAKKAPAGGVEQPLDMSGWIKSIQYRQALTNASVEAKAKTEKVVSELKEKAASGDEGARTQLQKIGELAYDKNFEMVAKMSPEEKDKFYKSQIEIAEGMETPKEKLDREERRRTSYIQAGYSPADVEALVKDPSAKVGKSITQLSDEAKYYGQLQDSFGDEAAKKIAPQLAAGASLGDILPNVGQTQSHFAQTMAETEKFHREETAFREREAGAREKEAAAAEKRAASELGQEKLELMAKQIEVKLAQAENQAFRQNFEDLIGSIKAGVSVPADVTNRYIDELAKRAGLKREESWGLINYLTFGYLGSPKVSYGPDIEGGKKVLDELAPGTEGIAPKPRTSREMGPGAEEAEKVRVEEKKRKAGMNLSEDPDASLRQFLQILGTQGPVRPK